MFVLYLLLVLSSLVTISLSESPTQYPNWPTNCSFKRDNGFFPKHAEFYAYSHDLTTQDDCEGVCGLDTQCGIYFWRDSDKACLRYQMTKMMLEEKGIGDIWESHSREKSGTKLCKGEYLPTNDTCLNYKHTAGKTPSVRFFAGVGTDNFYSPMNEEICMRLCDFYSECQTVLYKSRGDGERSCRLYNRTATDGEMDDCYLRSGETCGLYERQCARAHTSSSPAPPTTSSPIIMITIISSFLFYKN